MRVNGDNIVSSVCARHKSRGFVYISWHSLESYGVVAIIIFILQKRNRLRGEVTQLKSPGYLLSDREGIKPRSAIPQSHGKSPLGLLNFFLEQSLGWIGRWKERGKEERKEEKWLGFVSFWTVETVQGKTNLSWHPPQVSA